MDIRTSISHPLGITFCPGKHASSMYGYVWKRDLKRDLDEIERFGAQVVLTLIEDQEFEELNVTGLGDAVKARGIAWYHLPIKDVHVPDERFESAWTSVGAEIRRLLTDGGRVVVHCKGGLGRAGTVAARILVETGTPPAEAIRQVRAARNKTIETASQERYVLGLATGAPG